MRIGYGCEGLDVLGEGGGWGLQMQLHRDERRNNLMLLNTRPTLWSPLPLFVIQCTCNMAFARLSNLVCAQLKSLSGGWLIKDKIGGIA